MSAKIDVVLLQAVKSLWQKNEVVSVAVAYAKNVLFAKWLAKPADALAKNNLVQKKEQEKKHIAQVWEIRSTLELYSKAEEPLVIKRKVTPSWGLYEKVHEIDVKKAFEQWKVALPIEIVLMKQVRDTTWVFQAQLNRWVKKLLVPFTIKESLY
jgi:ribosomal protein L9